MTKNKKDGTKQAYKSGAIKGYKNGKKSGLKKGYREGVFDTMRCLLTNNAEELKLIEETMTEEQKEVIDSLKVMTRDISLYDSDTKH